jgi:hypothetical protein
VRRPQLRRNIETDSVLVSEKRVCAFEDILENIGRLERFTAGLDPATLRITTRLQLGAE